MPTADTTTSRRDFMKTTGSALAASAALGAAAMTHAQDKATAAAGPDMDAGLHIFKSLKWGMAKVGNSVEDKFKILKDLGYDGIEVNAPGVNVKEVAAAVEKTGFPVDGSVCAGHWSIRLTDPNPAVRAKAQDNLARALQDTYDLGGNTVLLVPGHGKDGPADKIEKLAIEHIKRVLPIAARLGVYIAIENVWNHMLYDHSGPGDQTAERMVKFVDACDSPWVGMQFDIGNHVKYGPPAKWIRTLGKRVVKLDVKDFKLKGGFCKIGDGDADWPAVRKALKDIGFVGWAAAEVGGGGEDRLKDILARMNRTLGPSEPFTKRA